jgi:hypothetical protein
VSEVAIWLQRHPGGYGYETRNLARVLHRGARVKVRCYSWWEHGWVIKRVSRVVPATEVETRRMEALEQRFPPNDDPQAQE